MHLREVRQTAAEKRPGAGTEGLQTSTQALENL